MKKSICLISSILLFMSGCLSDDDEVATSASQTEVAATVNSTSAAEVFSNFTLNLNPDIVITGNTATYYNNDDSQGFELATSILSDVSVKYADTPSGGLELIFYSPSFSDGNITITLSGFVDRGNEGFIDEFTVEKAEVKKIDGTTNEITSVAGTKKSNLGTKLKRSVTDMAENNISVPDFSGSPTVAEWDKYMIGTAILATELSTTGGELTLVQFTTSSTGRYIDVAGSDAGDSGTFTYTYEQDGSTKGILTTKSSWVESDQTDPNYNNTFEDMTVRSLTFTDFYNGKHEITAGTETNLANGSVKNDTAPFDYGDFNTITDVEIYLSDNKITVSTN